MVLYSRRIVGGKTYGVERRGSHRSGKRRTGQEETEDGQKYVDYQ